METPPAPSRFDDAALRRIEQRLHGLTRARLKGEGRRAAVVVPLCHVGETASVLFTRRSDRVGTHKGQVSFPGGMADEDDDHLEQTALRELEEEVGVSAAEVRVLGRFHDAQAITGVFVTPIVAWLGDIALEDLRLSAAEIDTAFSLTLTELSAPDLRYQQEHARGRMHVFDGGPHPVWGLTAYILAGVLEEVLDLRLPPTDVRPFEVLG